MLDDNKAPSDVQQASIRRMVATLGRECHHSDKL
jgi:hypothetical protein